RFRVDYPSERIAISPDGHWLVKTFDNITLLDARTGHIVSRLDCDREQPCGRGVFIPGSNLVVVATNKHLFFWDAATGERLRCIERVSQKPRMRASPDGKLLAISNDGDEEVQLIDTTTGEMWTGCDDPSITRSGVLFTWDGRQIVTWGWNVPSFGEED